MEFVRLLSIGKNKNKISYEFEVSEGLKEFFSGKEFAIEYPVDIAGVPDAVLAVPFVCNVLPIIWLSDSELHLDELDTAFFNSIEEFKKGYVKMYPDATFAGKITVEKLVLCRQSTEGKSAMFFSGGLDSTFTFVRHYKEKPDMISVWGADVKVDNEKGWELVHGAISETAKLFNLEDYVIRSTFRLFDEEWRLSQKYLAVLHDGWWHGVKHGIGLLGHVAPLAYLFNYRSFYIASTNCPLDGAVTCASNPSIDNYVRFANCQVFHDGFEYSRQDKTRGVVEFCEKEKIRLQLHVCWETQQGGNCCRCEKCYRTIAALIAEGANPEDFGFEGYGKFLVDLPPFIVRRAEKYKITLKRQWVYVQARMKDNIKYLKTRKDYKYLKWILNADFMHYETLKVPLSYKLRYYPKRKWLYNHFGIYRWLAGLFHFNEK